MIIGIDLGSRNIKLVVYDKKIIKTIKFDTIKFYKEYCNYKDDLVAIDIDKLKQDINIDKIDKIVSTGYGRNLIEFSNSETLNELKAHTIGAIYQTKLLDFTLLDLGGQDSKIIQVKNGKMVNFETNDKCAASSGRYLENIANILNVDMQEFSKYYKNPIKLSNVCAIFTESEIISNIVKGTDYKKIIAGANYSVVDRIKHHLQRFMSDTLIFTGGIAKNQAVVNILKDNTDFKNIIIPELPQFNGAIGCVVNN